jgi:glycosyltransferase involved in cell wall biosynthesis
MKLLYFYQYFNTREGCTGTRSYEFCTHLLEQGHQVTMVTGVSEHSDRPSTRLVEEEDIGGIRVLRLGIPYSQNLGRGGRVASFGAYASLASIMTPKIGRPDVVFATSTPLTVGIPGLAASYCFRVPFVFEVRDLWPEIPVALGFLDGRTVITVAENLERLLYRKAKEIIALSPGMERGVIARGGDPEHVTVIPNMADLTLFQSEGYDPEWRSELGVPNDAMLVVHIGAIGYANDVGQMLDVAALLVDSGIYFAIVGSGSERNKLEARAAREGLVNVRFGGPYPRSTMPGLLRAADVGFLCFRHEPVLYNNSANKFGDYLAAGLPVLVTYPGWQSKLLERYQAGIRVDSGAENISRELLLLRENADLRRRMGARALALARDRFARDKLVVEFERVLLRALEPSPIKALT